MQKQNNKLDFSNQKIFIGIDVHKKKWVVSIRMHHIELKTYSMEPKVEQLVNYLKKNYPRASYYSVYEAGFSGYWIDRQLRKNGIRNIIVNPADIPTTNREKDKKRRSQRFTKISTRIREQDNKWYLCSSSIQRRNTFVMQNQKSICWRESKVEK